MSVEASISVKDVIVIIVGLLTLGIGYYVKVTNTSIKELVAEIKALAGEFKQAIQRVDDKREVCQKEIAQSYASKRDLARVEGDVSELYDNVADLRVQVHEAKAYASGVLNAVNKAKPEGQ